MIRVGILTSSRADYGIYLPLLRRLEHDAGFAAHLIVFGTHLSHFHGYTLKQIIADGFTPFQTIETLLTGDTPSAISSSYSLTSLKFADFWQNNQEQFDLVFTLGDRYEMAAAVNAAIPYGITFAHLHGGETTLGAIDNIYRHQISLASTYHFTSTAAYSERLLRLLDASEDKIFNIGALSLESLGKMPLLTEEQFKALWNIDLNISSILVTVHPETVNLESNILNTQEVVDALQVLAEQFQIIITMPNADTSGLILRDAFSKLAKESATVKVIENFGTQSYFTCMKHVNLLIGNTSSGIIEAASFGKFVLNVGNRQQGRLSGENVINIPFSSEQILEKVGVYSELSYEGENPYFQAEPSQQILEIIKSKYAPLS
jgi:GDP/UDP-N,N'-diacetylbacillosamine 2-epimerase (hydrolysing)